MSPQTILIWGASLAAVGVLLGAFGAHWLRPRLDAQAFEWFQTGLTYQFVHSLAILAVALILIWFRTTSLPPASGHLPLAAYAFILGIILFSGTLYLMAIGAPHWLGMITPIGGVLFIAGWVAVIVSIWRI